MPGRLAEEVAAGTGQDVVKFRLNHPVDAGFTMNRNIYLRDDVVNDQIFIHGWNLDPAH